VFFFFWMSMEMSRALRIDSGIARIIVRSAIVMTIHAIKLLVSNAFSIGSDVGDLLCYVKTFYTKLIVLIISLPFVLLL